MPKMLKRSVCPVFAALSVAIFALAAVPESARADDRPAANDVGRFFGISLSCGCLAEDEKFLTAFYYAVFAEDFDQSYADNMVGEIRYYANQIWCNQASLCSSVCSSEYMMMGDIVEDADAAMASPVFEGYFNEAYERYFGISVASGDDQEAGKYGQWNTCYWRPLAPNCKDLVDPAERNVTVQENAELPPCTVTDEMFVGQCEGRQKGRVSGW